MIRTDSTMTTTRELVNYDNRERCSECEKRAPATAKENENEKQKKSM